MAQQPAFVELNELASNRVGGKILFATDDWFAVAENLLKGDKNMMNVIAAEETGHVKTWH